MVPLSLPEATEKGTRSWAGPVTLGLERRQKARSPALTPDTAEAQAWCQISTIRQTCKVSLLRLPRYPQDVGIDTGDCLPFKELKCRSLYPLVSSLKTELPL